MRPPSVRVIDPNSYALPRIVRTPRLRFTLPSLDYAEALAEARAESLEELYPWFHEAMGTPAQEMDSSWQVEVLLKQIEAAERRERLPYYFWCSEVLIGCVELLPIWRRGQFKLSYWVRSMYMKRGLGSEAVNAITRLAFEALDARLVTTGHAEPNTASKALARKLGFEFFARQPLGCEMPDGSLVPGIAYAMQFPAILPSLEITWEA